MFVALETAAKSRDGILGGILNILSKPKPRIEAREALGAVYGVIVASKSPGNSDWKKIASLADRYGDRMLLPEGCTPPEPLRAAACPGFERRVLLDTAIEIVRRTRMPMYRRVAGLVDKTGDYADFLFPMLRHYTSVKVLTDSGALYETQAERMMEELGAPVTLCESGAAFSDCVLVVAPNGVPDSCRCACPVLSFLPPEHEQSCDFITNLRVAPPPELLSLCPKGIHPHDFAAALYEFCGANLPGFVAERVIWRYRQADLSQVVHAVLRAATLSPL